VFLSRTGGPGRLGHNGRHLERQPRFRTINDGIKSKATNWSPLCGWKLKGLQAATSFLASFATVLSDRVIALNGKIVKSYCTLDFFYSNWAEYTAFAFAGRARVVGVFTETCRAGADFGELK
jgi:hypothetical protein